MYITFEKPCGHFKSVSKSNKTLLMAYRNKMKWVITSYDNYLFFIFETGQRLYTVSVLTD